jgi:hypothetical protein
MRKRAFVLLFPFFTISCLGQGTATYNEGFVKAEDGTRIFYQMYRWNAGKRYHR